VTYPANGKYEQLESVANPTDAAVWHHMNTAACHLMQKLDELEVARPYAACSSFAWRCQSQVENKVLAWHRAHSRNARTPGDYHRKRFSTRSTWLSLARGSQVRTPPQSGLQPSGRRARCTLEIFLNTNTPESAC
jgi:hypothetical protein